MKYIEINRGDTFSLAGTMFTLVDIEKGTAILKNVRKGDTITYGLDALKRIVRQFGYEITA